MVTTGFSRPYVAKYANSGATVTYSGGMILGRGVSVSTDIETADDNDFYADNVIAESESGVFTGGTATVTVDGLDSDAATLIFGLPTAENVTVGGETVAMLGYGDGSNPPDVGFGFIRRTMMRGVTQYWPVIFPKVKFSIAGEEAATQEEDIDWQTQELEATLMRDDTAAHNWKRVSETGFATEDEAFAVLQAILGGAAGGNG